MTTRCILQDVDDLLLHITTDCSMHMVIDCASNMSRAECTAVREGAGKGCELAPALRRASVCVVQTRSYCTPYSVPGVPFEMLPAWSVSPAYMGHVGSYRK